MCCNVVVMYKCLLVQLTKIRNFFHVSFILMIVHLRQFFKRVLKVILQLLSLLWA